MNKFNSFCIVLFILFNYFEIIRSDVISSDSITNPSLDQKLDTTTSILSDMPTATMDETTQTTTITADSENTGIVTSDSMKKQSVFKRQHIPEKKLNDIDKEWEKGDEEVELELEFEHDRKVAKKLNTVDYNDIPNLVKLAKEDPFKLTAGSGTKMMFAELKKKEDGTKWDKPTVDKMAARWQGLIRTASMTAEFFNIDQDKILVSVGKTWMLRDIIKFVVVQPEVDVVRLDNKDYTKANFEELLEEEEDF